VVGKQLSALLQILLSNGVTRYQTPELTLELGPQPAKRGATAINVSPEALDAEREDDEEEPGDMRFALERLTAKHFPAPKADPRKGKAS
jgi:hypothetical protein